MIWETDNGEFCISAYGSWIPGVFDTRRAANYGFRFPDEVLLKLMRKNIIITFEMLQQARKDHEDQDNKKALDE